MKPGRVLKGRTEKVVHRPKIKTDLPPELKRQNLDHERSFAVELEDCVATFIPFKGILGKNGELRRLPKKPKQIGVIINCLDEVWPVDAEATSDSSLGLVVSAPQKGEKGRHSHKPVMAGNATISGDEENYSLKFNLSTLYDDISTSPRSDSVKGSGTVNSDGSASVTISYEIKF
jgi:hypothetical protein